MNPTLFGFEVRVSSAIPDKAPRMKLSPDLPVSDAFRVDYDRWLADFFGYEVPIYFGRDIIHGNDFIAMSHRTFVMIKAALS